MSTYFISDLHLEPQQPQTLVGLTRFLHAIIEDADALYILGDLFEMWIGDDDDDAFVEQCCMALSAFSARRRLFVMHGNRDFLMGAGFSMRTSAQLLPDPHVIDLYGRRTLLMHGDSLCIDDAPYMQMRQQLRSRSWQQDILARPLAERRSLGAALRAHSRAANANKAAAIMDVNEQEIARYCELHDVDLLIHGHTHRPGTHRYDSSGGRTRLVLGDWNPDGTVLRMTPAGALGLLRSQQLPSATGTAGTAPAAGTEVPTSETLNQPGRPE